MSNRPRSLRQSHTLQDFPKAWMGTEWIQPRIALGHERQPAGAAVAGLFQPPQGLILFTEADVNESGGVRVNGPRRGLDGPVRDA